MSRHSTEDLEAVKAAPRDRYRFEVLDRRFGFRAVQLVTTHVLPVVGEAGEPLEPVRVETRAEDPPSVFGERWAWWKGRRMVAAAKRRDVREGQPWA